MSIERVVFDWAGRKFTVTKMFDQFGRETIDPSRAESMVIEDADTIQAVDVEFAQVYTIN